MNKSIFVLVQRSWSISVMHLFVLDYWQIQSCTDSYVEVHPYSNAYFVIILIHNTLKLLKKGEITRLI